MADGNAPKRIFLRKILYRIDYQLLTEKVFEGIFEFVSEKFGEYFSTRNQEMLNAIGFEINPAQIDQSRLNTKAQNVFNFSIPQSPENDGRVLKIGRTFTYLEVTLNLETTGISYYEWMSEIVKYIKSNDKMFRLSRIGLRKFNNFYILDEDLNILEKIFTIQYLNKNDLNGFVLDGFTDVQIYISEEYKLNFSKEYSTGNLKNETMGINNKPAHLISFDFDLYSQAETEATSFIDNPKQKLEEMNLRIYNFFANIIHPDIIEKINRGDTLEEYRIIPF